MVYKSKKTNKRRYLKRKSHKVMGKKMYGGLGEAQYNNMNNMNRENISDKNINNTLVKPPSTLDNVKTAALIGLQLLNNISATGLKHFENRVKNLSKIVGIDPNGSVKKEVENISKKTQRIVVALQSKEGQKALSNLKTIVTDVSEKVVAPGLIKVADTVIEHSDEFIEKGTKVALGVANSTPVVGTVIGIPKLISDVGGIIEDLAAMINRVLEIGKDTVDTFEGEKGKITSALAQVYSIANKGNELLDKANIAVNNGNEFISENLTSIKKEVDKYGSNIQENVNKYNDTRVQSGGKSLNKIKREGKIIGGRIIKSKDEFFSKNVNISQIKQQYGGKNITKRNTNKFTSRKR